MRIQRGMGGCDLACVGAYPVTARGTTLTTDAVRRVVIALVSHIALLHHMRAVTMKRGMGKECWERHYQ